MKKLTETDIYVECQFNMSKLEFKDIIEKRDIKEINNEKIYGICIFNKSTQEFILDEKKTDSYFLRLNKEHPRYKGLCNEILYVYCKLIEITKQKRQFPEKIHIATG